MTLERTTWLGYISTTTPIWRLRLAQCNFNCQGLSNELSNSQNGRSGGIALGFGNRTYGTPCFDLIIFNKREREMVISRFPVFARWYTTMRRRWRQSTKRHNLVDDTKQGNNFCWRRLMEHHIDNGERQMAIRNEATGFIHLRLADLSLGVMVGTMALGRYWHGTMNKSYAWC